MQLISWGQVFIVPELHLVLDCESVGYYFVFVVREVKFLYELTEVLFLLPCSLLIVCGLSEHFDRPCTEAICHGFFSSA